MTMSAVADAGGEWAECRAIVVALHDVILQLQEQSRLLPVSSATTEEWFALLTQKLIPQLGGSAFLVVAVVGGTNTGKSSVFNQLAGSRASAASPLAAGTRQAVCLVPGSMADPQLLQGIFPELELRPWDAAEDALSEASADQLFWRECEQLPDGLLLLDTPDIDSDARMNWARADVVRRAADVLIAVLTQQKYNDAVVLEFFQRAAAEGRFILPLFNQVLLPEDEPYWPIWLQTFCARTAGSPQVVFLAPADRRAAESLQLPFYRRDVTAGTAGGAAIAATVENATPDGGAETGSAALAMAAATSVSSGAASLREYLCQLPAGELRIRSLRGSVAALLDPVNGIPAWLEQVESAARRLQRVTGVESENGLILLERWPSVPVASVIDVLRDWWKQRQPAWAQAINRFYGAAGEVLLQPIRRLSGREQGRQGRQHEDGLARYREQEWLLILQTVAQTHDKLQQLAGAGSGELQERIAALLTGDAVEQLIRRLQLDHEECDLQRELQTVVDSTMRRMECERPQVFAVLGRVNQVSAAVRPVTSAVMFSLGFGPAGDLLAPLAGQAVMHTAVDVLGGTAAAIAGEAAVTTAAESGAGVLQNWFCQLQAEFSMRRAGWLGERLQECFLGDLPEQMRIAAGVVQSAEFRVVSEHLDQLRRLLPKFAETPTERGEHVGSEEER